MDQEFLTGIIVLAVLVICIIALVVILIRKIISKIRGGEPEKKQPQKVKNKVKKEKVLKEKKKTKKKKEPVSFDDRKMMIEEAAEQPVIMPEDDDSETILMVVAPKAIRIQLISDTTGKVFETDCADQILIGRKEACDIRITGDKSVSGNHCLLKKINDDTIAVVDLNSSNGTYLNDSKVLREEYVTDGDTLEIGRTRYIVRIS